MLEVAPIVVAAPLLSAARAAPRLSGPALEQAWASMFACRATPAASPVALAPSHGAALFGER